MYKSGDKVISPHGSGVIREIEEIYGRQRCGVFHDEWPAVFVREIFRDGLLFYESWEIR